MSKRYGGVANTKNIDEIEEAEIFVKKTPHFTKLEITKALAVCSIKLIPTTLLIGLVFWGISFVFLKLVGVT